MNLTVEKKNYIVAIDLGSSNVAVTVGSPAANGKINVDAISIKKSKGIVRGEVRNVEQAAQSIREAVAEVEEQLGIRILEAYTGISGSHISCVKHPYYVYISSKDGEVFQEDVDRLNQSMSSVQAPEGYSLLNIIPQHYVVSDETEEIATDPVGMIGQTLGSTFNLIIGENAIISRLDKALQRANIKQTKLFINPLVAAEAVTFPDEKELGVAVVDLGGGTTDICIIKDGIVRYIGVIPLGATAINKDIRSFGIMERHVEELKVAYGCAMASLVDADKLIKIPGRTPNDYKEISFKNLASIIEARLMDIVDYVMDEIKASGYENKLGAGIILTGGSAQLKEIQKLFEKHTKLDVRIAVPEVLISEESKELVTDSKLSAAIGILHEGLLNGTSSVEDLVTSKKIDEEIDKLAQEDFQDEGEEIEDSFIEEESGKHSKSDDYIEEERKPKKGFMSRIKNAFEKTFDLQVLDEDNDTI